MVEMIKVATMMMMVMMIGSYQAQQLCADQDIQISENEIDAPIQQYEWKQTDSGVTVGFLRTSNNTIWRGVDRSGGRRSSSSSPRAPATWTEQSEKIPDFYTQQQPSLSYGVSEIFGTSSPFSYYFLGFGNKLWTTEDAGANYVDVSSTTTPYFIDIIPHPSQEQTAAGIALSAACVTAVKRDSMKKPKCYHELWITQNLGKNWTFSVTYVQDFTWNTANITNAEGTYWYTNFTDSSSNQNSLDATDEQLVYYDGNEHKIVFDTTSGFYASGNLVTVVHLVKKKYSFLVSINGGHDFASVSFAHNPVDFTVVDEDEDVIFVNVKYNTNAKFGTTFVSDGQGQNFAESLEGVLRDSRTNGVSMTRVKGLDGIYLANQYPDTDDTDVFHTVVSFDKGGQWKVLNNVTDEKGQQVVCNEDDDCSLHLHMEANKIWATVQNPTTSGNNKFYGPVYSSPSAIGLILATGNTGEELSEDEDELATFLSLDAGWTWFNIANGTNIYEYGDYGSLIALMSSNSLTNLFKYTVNQGITMNTCNITNNGDFTVNDIILHPLNNYEFIVFGTRTTEGVQKGVVFSADFQNFHERFCTEADYYQWFPTSSYGGICQLGRSTAYTRRNRTAECFDDQFEQITTVANCSCSLSDYECDYCFELVDGKCEDACDGNQTAPPPDCSSTYSVPSGYRLIPGDTCNINDPQAINMLLPVTKTCPSATSGDSTTGDSTADGGQDSSTTTTGTVTGTVTGTDTSTTTGDADSSSTTTTGGHSSDDNTTGVTTTTGGHSSDDNTTSSTTGEYSNITTTTTGDDGNVTISSSQSSDEQPAARKKGLSGGAVAGIVLGIVSAAGIMTFVSSYKGRQWIAGKWARCTRGRGYQRPMDAGDDPELIVAAGLSDSSDSDENERL